LTDIFDDDAAVRTPLLLTKHEGIVEKPDHSTNRKVERITWGMIHVIKVVASRGVVISFMNTITEQDTVRQIEIRYQC
jgi:hypothetical protein